MAWESIGDVGAALMLKIERAEFPLYDERHTDTGAATNAPRSVAPQRGGRDSALRMGETGKGADAETPAQVLRGGNVKPRTEADWRLITTSLHTMRRTKVTGCPTASPTRPVALVLVMDDMDGHSRFALG